MSLRFFPIFALALLPMLFANIPSAGAQEKPTTPDQKLVVDAVKTIFGAASVDDIAKFQSITTPSFYIFDGGARFDGGAIMDLIKAQHAAGKRFEWNVTEPDVHVSGDTAWIAYVNKGSITDASGTVSQTWLESAFLQKQSGVWKIAFMHSTRVPMPSQPTHSK